ncbi:[protein-PII] uridylyltransferase [Kribbella sp.]|uniref:[protein-PII] uridylyltransferase n=1 Tax=Kribbella sp. TaxID=1871183 RepID=UPI002D661604|nr:[protein-PII] uridylyltransferase [Kribbella sp.]HZX02507.1 [protein-PII] uridylyltransferase [Kribbella sp.]
MVDRAEQRRVRAEEADELLRLLLAKACDALGVPAEGVALVAVGGYGREELSPYSDLDVMLVHAEGYPRIDELAAQIWYPLWDSRTKLDHSVRTLAEAQQAAAADDRVALGLLDARHVAGDTHLTLQLRSVLMADWRRTAKSRLPGLAQACRDRASTVGELAHLAEPDLKEAYGGLRDAVVLRALVASWLIDVPHPVVERARRDLLEIRDVLHEVAGRATDRLVADLAGEVAAGLGLSGRDELLRHVYATGRTLAHVCDVSWRRVESLMTKPPRSRRRHRSGGPLLLALDEGVGQHEGEVVLMPDARPERNPVLGLRAAAVAADRELVLSPAVCARLAASAADFPEPWPGEARRLLCALLGAGSGLLEVWEALDQAGYISRLLPEWDAVRFRPPQSAIHRFTVDRHLLETCVEASAMVRDVRRPDLLLVAALVHDLGKGLDGDHSVTGARIAARVARRIGFNETDADTITLLVRQHLILAQVATRRDLDDPMTVDMVAGIARSTETLDLLEALTYADARAAGPAASSPWRMRLVGDLCRRVRTELAGGESMWTETPPVPVPVLHQVVGVGRLGVTVTEHHGDLRVNVAVPDQVGTLSTVAAVLAVERLAVRSAVVTSVDGLGISQWTVAGSPPDPVRLRDRLAVALRDSADVVRRLAARDSAQARVASRVDLLAEASETATVLQVRAHDRPGLLYDVTAAIAATGADIRSAHVSTLGAECVDVFYLTDRHGSPLEPEDARTTAKSVLDRLSF